MSFNKGTFNSLVAILSFFTLSAYASQVYVEKATGSGVNDSDLITATDLISSAVNNVSTNTVVDQPNKADFILRPKLIRLGEAYVMSLSKVQDGQQVFSSQLKAAQMDELDKVSQRLTRAVLEGKRAESDARVGEVTNEEAKEGTQRRPARGSAYLSFGGSTFGNLNSSGIGYSLGLGYSFDVNRVRLKLMGEANVNGAAFLMSGGLGGNYFFSLGDISPYLSADFGLGAAKIDGGGAFSGELVGGFVAGVGAGVELLRTSSINLDLGFRVGFLFHANSLGMPQVYSLRLGLYF